jgi:hypothetical protein
MRLSSLSVVLSAIATSVHADNQEDEDRHKHKATAKSNSDLNIPDNFKQITFDYELPYGQAWGIKFEIFDNIGPIAAKAGSVNDFADYDAYIKEVISKALKEHGTPVAFDVTLGKRPLSACSLLR